MNVLAKFRESKGLTQEQVGEILGTTKATVSRWETEKRRPDPAMAVEIEKKLGIPRHELRPDLYAESPANYAASGPSKSIFGCMKGMVTLPDDFNPEEPFWELQSDFSDYVDMKVKNAERKN
jgi:transcriptional regulator with XRE-family HTH domain